MYVPDVAASFIRPFAIRTFRKPMLYASLSDLHLPTRKSD